MAGKRLNLTTADKNILGLFFTNRTYKANMPYFQLEDNWKTTDKISKESRISWKRAQQILEKLSGIGFLDGITENYKERKYHFWYITREGLYYFLSTIKKERLVPFLRSNNSRMRIFEEIERLVIEDNLQMRYFTNQMENIVRNYQYYLIPFFIERWHYDSFGTHASNRIIHPSIKKALKTAFGHDTKMIDDLSRRYGRID